MPKYYKYTSKYNPYTFQEMWEPALVATQAHQQYATQLAAQEASAASLQNYLDPNSPEDAEMYNQYTNYINNIRNASRQLSSKGMSSSTFNDVLGLTTQYATVIKPIEDMVQNKKTAISNTNQVLSEHPDYVLNKETNPMNMSLSSFKYGIPQLKFISGNQIQNDVATLSSIYAQANENITTEQFSRFKDIVRTQYGLTWEQFQDAMSGVGDAADALNQIKNIVYAKYGVYDPNGNLTIGDEDFVKLEGYAQNGLYGAVGKPNLQLTESESSLARKEARANQAAYYSQIDHQNKELMNKLQLALTFGDNETAEKILNSMGINVNGGNTNANNLPMPEGVVLQDNYYKTNSEFAKEEQYLNSRANNIELGGKHNGMINLGMFKGGLQGRRHLDLTEKVYKDLFNKDMPQYITVEEYRAIKEQLHNLADINSPTPATIRYNMGGFGVENRNNIISFLNAYPVLDSDGKKVKDKLESITSEDKNQTFYADVVTRDMGNIKAGAIHLNIKGKDKYINFEDLVPAEKNLQNFYIGPNKSAQSVINDIREYNELRQQAITNGVRLDPSVETAHLQNINMLMDYFKTLTSQSATSFDALKKITKPE